MKLFGIVFCYLCVNFLDVSVAYKAGVLQADKELLTKEIIPFIYDASKQNVDILVLPSPDLKETTDNFEETVTILSNAASQAKLYIVATLYEKISCRNVRETVKSNLVFNRNGAIISDYRKPVSNLPNCTSSPSELVTFNTDFGVTFGLLMDEDILLHDGEYMKGMKNFVMTVTNKDETYVNGAQLSTSWSYVNDANLISSKGIYIGKSGLKINSGRLVTADINSNRGSENIVVPVVTPISYRSEDLSQYITKPLDLTASLQGYKQTVCHRSFCCEFFVKTVDAGLKLDVSYSLAAFDGVHPFIPHHNVGAQTCAVFACAEQTPDLYRPTNNTNTIFKRISITANFTKQTVQYPIIHSTSMLPTENFKFETNTNDIFNQVTLEVIDSQNVMHLGIFGRDFSKDYDNYAAQRNNSENTYDIYDLIFNEDVQEFFDYVWIRLRILFIIVSIYVLEMM